MTTAARPLRSVLYIPASKERALEKARTLPVDAIIFDLEDAVAPDEKAAARDTLAAALTTGGYGARLMGEIESLARERGCQQAHVDTFSFQAREFYESLNYHVFATLDDYPPGHARYYLRKTL